MSDIINISNAESFDKVIGQSQKPVLVDFWAQWCGPCKAIAPILVDLSKEMSDSVQITKVDVDSNAELASRFNIRAIPTLLIFKDGNVVDTVVGLTSKEALKAKIEKAG
jgi:thioredoxin 1